MRASQLHDEELCLATILVVNHPKHTYMHSYAHAACEREIQIESVNKRESETIHAHAQVNICTRILLREEKVRVRESANRIVDASTNETHSPVHGL